MRVVGKIKVELHDDRVALHRRYDNERRVDAQDCGKIDDELRKVEGQDVTTASKLNDQARRGVRGRETARVRQRVGRQCCRLRRDGNYRRAHRDGDDIAMQGPRKHKHRGRRAGEMRAAAEETT